MVLKHFQILTPPIDVINLAQSMGIFVDAEPMLNPVTCYVNESIPAATITYNRDSARWNQRFAVAHSLGHVCHHGGRDFMIEDEDYMGELVDHAREHHANQFAADLLMPLWLLAPYVTHYRRDARRLADIFQVSTRAMEVRLRRF